jgi:hypothetical protein
MFPIATHLAVRATREHAQSALPDAPVVREQAAPQRRSDVPRARTARLLHRLAERIEPASACATD